MITFNSSYAVDLNTPKEIDGWFANEIISKKDLDERVKSYLKGKPELRNPGRLHLDINGDGKKDVVILTKKSDEEVVKIRIFICNKTCTEKLSKDIGSVGDTFLSLVNRGSIVEESESLPGAVNVIKLKTSSVKVINFGKSEIIFYWDPATNSILSLTIGD